MDYWRPKTYPDPPETYSAGDYLAGLLLIIAFIVMLVVLAVVEAVKFVAARAKART